MKKHWIWLLWFVLAGCNSDGGSGDIILVEPVGRTELQKTFDLDVVPELTLNISESEWNKLLKYYDQNSQNQEYVIAGTFRQAGGVQNLSVDSVGLRIRGNTSRRRPEGNAGEIHNRNNADWHHASFALNFKQIHPDQKYRGLDKLNLKWFKDDANYVREVYCYDLFERFGVWIAPQASYCRLKIHVGNDASPAYFGVYEMLEVVDDKFLKNRLGQLKSDKGFLWKASYGASLRSPDGGMMGVETIELDNSKSKVYAYALKTNELQLLVAKEQLKAFIVNLNDKNGSDFEKWLPSAMDVELLLKTYAVNVMVGMWDDYWINTNNYYFYFDEDGKFYFIPFDYDNTLGTSLIVKNSGTQSPLNWGSNKNPLITKILSIEKYRTLYVQYLRELADSNNNLFHYTHSMARISAWQALIQPYITNDTGEDMLIDDYPASWGNCGFYRLNSIENNWFKIRAANLP